MTTSIPIRQILFPTDFSACSELTARYVGSLAKAVHAKVAILHVVPWLPGWSGASEPYYNQLEPSAEKRLRDQQFEMEQAACRTLTTFKDKFFDSVESIGCLMNGGVSQTIVECAKDRNADLIMMATRGLGPMHRFLIGSTTAKVLHDSHVPVWTTPHVAELKPFRPWGHVVCAMDYRALDREVLLHANAVAQIFGSRLTVVSAVPYVRPSQDKEHASVGPLKREVATVLKRLVSKGHISAAIEVLEGSAGEVVREGAILDDADLIVIGSGHLNEPMGHLRTHAYEIIWNAPCPVLKI